MVELIFLYILVNKVNIFMFIKVIGFNILENMNNIFCWFFLDLFLLILLDFFV